MLLYGKNSVWERLKTNPATIEKIFLQDNISLPDIEKLVKINKIPLERVPARKIYRIKPAKTLQGIIARVDSFKYTPFEDLLTHAQNNKLSLIFLDRINDPQNLGSIIRTAACFGNFAIVIPKHEACEVTETVLHVSSGAENYISLAMVTNLSSAIIQAKENGCWILGAQVSAQAQPIDEISLPFPLGLVLGFEGEGIRHGIKKHLDLNACIPMIGAKLSLNVAIACAIFCHEIAKQKREKPESKPDKQPFR